MSDVLKTHQVRQRLTNKFGRITEAMSVPEHLVLFEVTVDGRDVYRGQQRDGYVARQRIDAVAVGIWRRTEHLVHGFEIKVSRGDLLAELRDPSKAEAGARMCDRWWLALGHPRLLRDDDVLPPGWGVLAPHGNGLTIVRKPEPMPGQRDARFTAGRSRLGLRRAAGWPRPSRRRCRDGPAPVAGAEVQADLPRSRHGPG